MWFKNLKAYRLTQPLSLDDDDLQTALSSNVFRPCGKQEMATMGFSSPLSRLGSSDSNVMLFHRVKNNFLIGLEKQQRLLPASVINSHLAEKVAHIEAETGSPVGKKQQQDIKQEITHQLLPQAFTKNSFTYGFIATDDNLVIVDASADGAAEAYLAMLRKALNSLPVLPLARHSLANQLTQWVSERPPANFTLLEEAELHSSDETASVIRCKNHPLDSDEIHQHLGAGKSVHKLAFDYNEAINGILCEDGSIKRIKFADTLKDSLDDIPKDQFAQRVDAEFALQSGEILTLIGALQDALTLESE